MFGHQDEPQQPAANDMAGAAPEPVSDGTLDDNLAALAHSPEPAAPAIEAHETDGFTAADVNAQPSSNDAMGTDGDVPLPDPVGAHNTTDANTLLDIKQQALQQLTPLVGHLDQSPEEKFRTTMMMIQASDNKDLLKTAYDTAQAIPDEKVRAQALLDVINEINYFTQHSE